MTNKSLKQLMAEAKQGSPLNKMSTQQAAVQTTNVLKKGVPTNKVTKGVFKKGNVPHNRGKSGTWGDTRKERASQMTEEKRKEYFGIIEKHTENTKAQMSDSAKQRWAKHYRPKVVADGIEYENFIVCAEQLGIHKDTVTYRCKAKSKTWEGWYFKEV